MRSGGKSEWDTDSDSIKLGYSRPYNNDIGPGQAKPSCMCSIRRIAPQKPMLCLFSQWKC